MKCNIITKDGVKEVLCYKTQYKNVVITKVDEHRYSVTHWQTGIALSYERYSRKKDVVEALPGVVEKVRSSNINLKQYCKNRKIKQINF